MTLVKGRKRMAVTTFWAVFDGGGDAGRALVRDLDDELAGRRRHDANRRSRHPANCRFKPADGLSHPAARRVFLSNLAGDVRLTVGRSAASRASEASGEQRECTRAKRERESAATPCWPRHLPSPLPTSSPKATAKSFFATRRTVSADATPSFDMNLKRYWSFSASSSI
jgi:hypothetical protein